MTASFKLPGQQVVDANGNPYNGARLYFYVATTTTPQNVYSDSGLTTPITQPVTADSAGRWVEIYMQATTYRVQLKTSADVLIADWDNVDCGKSLTNSQTTRTILTTGSGTYTTPANCKALNVRLVGGGGQGSGARATAAGQNAVGSGGGGGGYTEKFITAPAATYSYAVGAAGSGAAAGAAGNSGGNTTFGTLAGNGGSGGFLGNVTAALDVIAGGVGGTSTGGDINAGGSPGVAGIAFFSLTAMLAGNGANSQFGQGGRFGTPAASADGTAATGYGAGGGGAGNLASQGTRPGGAGTGGCIVIDEYY
jgi:hypothetical protein